MSEHNIKCQHPFGQGIHVVNPGQDNELLITMLDHLGLAEAVWSVYDEMVEHQDYRPGRHARAYTLLKADDKCLPRQMTAGFVILMLRKHYDRPQLYNRSVVILTEAGYEEAGERIAHAMFEEVRRDWEARNPD